MHVHGIWCGLAAICCCYSWNIDILDPRSDYNAESRVAGFQSTIAELQNAVLYTYSEIFHRWKQCLCYCVTAISRHGCVLRMYVWQQHQVQHSHHAVVQDSSSVQMAGVYQFLLPVLYLGVSRGTSAVMGIQTVVTTVMRPAALVSLQFCLEWWLIMEWNIID